MKPETDWILFDCMETLVDFDPVPNQADYAAWAFYNSGVESYWEDFDRFLALFLQAGRFLIDRFPEHKEWLTVDRFLHICHHTPTIGPDQIRSVAARLESSFSATYRSKCFVRADVKDVVPVLAQKALLGVVSNFKIKNGIYHILQHHELLHYFQFVLTSAEVGWRKPHDFIYQEALALTATTPDNILFIGDDPLNDQEAPTNHGMKSLLLDRYHKHPSLDSRERIDSFLELKEW